jgi:hypothetical protein
MAHRKKSIAILVYGESNSSRNALLEEKYKELAAAFTAADYLVSSEAYNDNRFDELAQSLLAYDAVLVWVNPIEQGNDRTKLDKLLTITASKGCMVSAHPETILKMGTKDVLFKTKDMEWGGDTDMYKDLSDFKRSFPPKLAEHKIRVLKQYRGNGGNGVFKVKEHDDRRVSITHAIAGNETRILTINELFEYFSPFFENGGMIIDQDWNNNMVNGMVRCYVSGTKVAGFGYQEINALYELNNSIIPPGKRYYFTENCGIFSDLRSVMESSWIPELQEKLGISGNRMPVIWDADFFINSINSPSVTGKYSLCEINVSCVSPFPPSAIKFIISEVGNRLSA